MWTTTEQAAPSTPASAKGTTYRDSTSKRLFHKDAAGVVHDLTAREMANFVRNSGFWFAQRQAPGTATTYSSTTTRAISADGWGITNENASATYQRTDTSGAVETGLQGRFYANFLKITSTGKLIVSQVLEGHDTGAIRGRTVRLQFWAKQLVAASPLLAFSLVQLNSAGTIDAMPATFISAFGANTVEPTLGTNLAYITPKTGVTPDNCAVSANHANATLSAAWQRFGAVFDVPANCKNLVLMLWGDSQFAATNGFALAQVSLTDGYEIQDWSPQTYAEELQRAQRFYCKSFNVDTAPVQSAGTATGELRAPSMVAASILLSGWGWDFPVPMRAAPATLTLYNPSAANAQVRNETLGTDCTASAVIATGEQRASIATTTPASTVAGNILGVHITADAEL